MLYIRISVDIGLIKTNKKQVFRLLLSAVEDNEKGEGSIYRDNSKFDLLFPAAVVSFAPE